MHSRSRGIFIPVALLVLAGCASLPKTGGGGGEKAEPRGPLHEKAAAVSGNGGFAAVGVGRDSSVGDAVHKAKAQVQSEMVRVVGSAMDAMAKDFAAETGEKKRGELDAFFDSALKQLKEDVLPRMTLAAMEYATRDGTTTAYAMMELNPRALLAALEDVRSSASVRARFLASRTCRAFEERANKYGEFRRQQGRR